jgi:hypothetical protein
MSTTSAASSLRERYIEELLKFTPDQASLAASLDEDVARRLLGGLERTRSWASILSDAFANNHCVGILSVVQSTTLEFLLLVPLGLVHGASANLRSILDMVASFSFYVDHASEFASLAGGRTNWLSRKPILDWHANHTPGFDVLKNQIVPLWDDAYRRLSATLHCLPGATLPRRSSLSERTISRPECETLLEIVDQVDRIRCTDPALAG